MELLEFCKVSNKSVIYANITDNKIQYSTYPVDGWQPIKKDEDSLYLLAYLTHIFEDAKKFHDLLLEKITEKQEPGKITENQNKKTISTIQYKIIETYKDLSFIHKIKEDYDNGGILM